MRIGELFAGYGGLGMGVKAAIGGDVAWVSEIDKGASKVLAHRFPDAPNLGDITTVDWSQVEPVDVLTGGFPCQDVSTAGKRAGMKPGTRSGLWTHFAYAIDQLRPELVVIENVRGLLSAEAHSDLEQRPELLAGLRRREGEPVLRALGAVLGDLADLGFHGRWFGLFAGYPDDSKPHVGGCHRRFREFIVATPADTIWRPSAWLTDAAYAECGGREWRPSQLRWSSGHVAGDGAAPSDSSHVGHDGAGGTRTGRPRPTNCHLLPTPRATDGTHGGPNQRGSSGDLMLPSAVAKLLPTPAVNDMGAGKTPEEWDAWTDRMKSEHGNGNGHGDSLSIEAMRLLPTPRASDAPEASSHARTWSATDNNLHNVTRNEEWGDYADAINRWANVLGRPAPAPTETSPKGKPRLSPRFEEWMMGLPDGWITNTPDVTWQEAVRMCGNGVVPQQAEAAIRWLLAINAEVAA